MHTLLYTVRTWLLKGICGGVGRTASFNPLENFIVFSDPRGGSTWLAEILLQVPRTALLWEPLNVALVPHFVDLGFSLRQHIPRSADWAEARDRFDALFRGEAIDHTTCRQPLRYLTAERMVVKICRGNALLPWLTRSFDFTYEPVYLVRHPFAVVSSQLNFGAWDDYGGFEAPSGPFDAYYRRHEDYLRSLSTDYEGLVAQWCLTNLVPLRSERNDVDWVTVFYEDMLQDPDREIERIFDRWEIPVPSGASAAARQASRTTKSATFRAGVDRQLSKWTSYFDDEQIERMQAVLDHFEVDLYGRSVYPNTAAVEG